jgi:hypothetical protein
MTVYRIALAGALAVFAPVSGPASAAVYNLNPTSFWTQVAPFPPVYERLTTGKDIGSVYVSQSFMMFDLSGLAGETVTGGTLSVAAGTGLESAVGSDITATLKTGASPVGELGKVDLTVLQGSRPTQAISIPLSVKGITFVNTLIAGSAFDLVLGQYFSGSVQEVRIWYSTGGSFGPEDPPASAITLSLEVAAVPLPATLPMLGTGLAIIGVFLRRRRLQP